jgi:hypothetical protein
MTAAGEPERSRDVSEPLSPQHQLLGPGNALVHHVFVRRHPIGVGKYPEELSWTEANQVSKIEKIQLATEIRVNVLFHQRGLSCGKSPWR